MKIIHLVLHVIKIILLCDEGNFTLYCLRSSKFYLVLRVIKIILLSSTACDEGNFT